MKSGAQAIKLINKFCVQVPARSWELGKGRGSLTSSVAWPQTQKDLGEELFSVRLRIRAGGQRL